MSTSETEHQKLYRLSCTIQSYDWGKQGSNSLAARLGQNANPEFKLDEQQHYAELWVGTHQNGPASLYADPSRPLQSIVSSDPSFHLGSALKKWPDSTDQLPYLFKVLSILKALPLQCHPDKSSGEKLHRKDPKAFVDSNHKPEIAVTIGKPGAAERIKFAGSDIPEDIAFTGFVGFRPLQDIHDALEQIPELQAAVANKEAVDDFLSSPSSSSLKAIYTSLLLNGRENPDDVASQVKALQARIEKENSGLLSKGTGYARLIEKVNEQYPGDVGIFATTFFMNFVQFEPGQAIYIGADEVHAYLEGDIIECMAVSDNVINVAFGPREERDIETFTDILTYQSAPASHWYLHAATYAQSKNSKTIAYGPPLDEFTVLHTTLYGTNSEEAKEVLSKSSGPTVAIVTRGTVRVQVEGQKDMDLGEGGVFYVVPGNNISVEALESKDGKAEVWWSTCLV